MSDKNALKIYNVPPAGRAQMDALQLKKKKNCSEHG